MRAATYMVDGAECVVYFFGAGQGGSIEANVERWKGQFRQPVELFPWLMILVLLVLAVENLLANKFYRRGVQEQGDGAEVRMANAKPQAATRIAEKELV